MVDDYNNIDLFVPTKSERAQGIKRGEILKELHDPKAPADLLYAPVAFAADNDFFRACFLKRDDFANTLKKLNQGVGGSAVVLGWLALALIVYAQFLESQELTDPEPWRENLVHQLSAVSTALSIVAFVAAGVSIFVLKNAWLRQRYCTERMRQFFYQNMLSHLPDILSASGHAPAEKQFKDLTTSEFKTFAYIHLQRSRAQFLRVARRRAGRGPDWLLTPLDAPAIAALTPSATLDAFFRLCLRFRIEWQAGYARYAINKASGLGRLISNGLFLFVFLAIGLHIIIVALASLGQLDENAKTIELWLLEFALVGLMLKAFEEGLQTQREAERYEEYLAKCERAKELFTAQGASVADKYAALLDLESAAYEEMKGFIRTNYDARFLL